MFEFFKKLFRPTCQHDYSVKIRKYVDTSFDSSVPSVVYEATCNRCGKYIEPHYVYGGSCSEEQVKFSLDQGHTVGQKFSPI